MSKIPDSQNPYAYPSSVDYAKRPGSGSHAKIIAPGIALIVTGALGMIMSIVSLAMAIWGEPEPPDPNLPEWIAEFEKGQYGASAAIIQALFIPLNGFIIFGGICMVRVKHWGVSLGSSIAAMINFGNCCCIIGLPIGIWALVILILEDVRGAFKRNV